MAAVELHQIVVGIDGSPSARHALRWAARLARLLGDDVTGVHGTGLLDHVDGRLVPAHPHRAALRDVVEREWCGPLVHGGLPHRVVVTERPAVDAVLEAAAERPTDLIVVGTRGTGLAAAQALGSTALHLLRRATTPVLVVPDPAEDGGSVEVRRLLVGVDGSPESLGALRWAARLAARTGAVCDVVAAIEDAPVFPLGPAGIATAVGEEDAPERVTAFVERTCVPLRALGVPYQVTVKRGRAVPTLLATIRDRHADLVVVGASGAGAPGDPLAGSVSRRIAHEARRPVVVVPASATSTPLPEALAPALTAPGPS
jgi:nucleotide-binding universal stress UspA family protein